MDRLGIIDWGIGGISIYKLIKRKLGDIPVVYFSDTGVTPYGKMTRPELVGRLNRVISFLKSRDVTHLVIGCNAASTAIEHLDAQGTEIIGMIESGVAAVMKAKPTRLGLIGGRRTVLSGVYRRAFAEKGVVVEQRIAQPLSGMIENGDIGSKNTQSECKKILAPIKNCSHILLACTHYPAIAVELSQFVSPQTRLIDPANELVRKVRRWKIPTDGSAVFLTSGNDIEMKTAAFDAWGVKLNQIMRVSIP